MLSTSAKQHRVMQAVASIPSFTKKAVVAQAVGKDFSAADKGRTFSKGGTMKIRKFADAGYVDGEDGNQYRDYDPDKMYSGLFTDDETGGLAENTPTRSTAKAASTAPARATSTAPRATYTAAPAPAARAAPVSAASTSRLITNDAKAAKAPASSELKQKTVSANDPLEVFSQAARARRAKKLQDELAALDREAGKTSNKSDGKRDAAYQETNRLTDKGYKAAGGKKAGGSINKYARGGGIESRGKTKGKFV